MTGKARAVAEDQYPLTDEELAPLVKTGHEAPYLDYKGPGSWVDWSNGKKVELVRDMMAFANSDRFGYVIIGVSEGPGKQYSYDGVTHGQAASFDPSPIREKAKDYADPEVSFLLLKPTVDGKLYVVIRVAPFQTVPHICLRSFGTILDQAAIYTRSEGSQTIKVPSAEYMRRLVDRATQNSADALVARIRELVTKAGPTTPDPRLQFQAQIDEARGGPRGRQ